MFTNNHSVATLTLALSLVAGVAKAQNNGYAPAVGYPLPGGFTAPAGFEYPVPEPTPVPAPAPVVTPLPYPVHAPVAMLQPPVRLGFQWAMSDYGMNVLALRYGGHAEQVGLLPGDIIVQINEFQITGWNEYCTALHDAMYGHAGQIEMWLYRPTPAGYEMQYVSFTIHEEQVVVVVPCCYHEEKCHSHHVSCWNDRLVYLNHHWKQHCHGGGKASGHHGLNVNFLGTGINLNFHKGGANFGDLFNKHGHDNHDNHGHDNHGHHNHGGQFGNFKFNEFKPQIKHFTKENFQKQNSNFEKHFKPQFNHKHNHNHKQIHNHGSKSHGNHGSNFNRSSNGGGNSMKSFSSQLSRGMKSMGGFNKK